MDIKDYVDGLFRHQPITPQIKDLKEEIVSNMLAKRDDLIAQGLDPDSATKKAEESLSDIENLIDGNQLTDMGKYHLECAQTLLLNSILFWILSMPLLFTGYAPFCYLGLIVVILSGCIYLWRKNTNANGPGFLSVTASKRREKIAWIVWALFFLVAAGSMAALTFGSDLWFGRPLSIDGPYQMANIAVRFYWPLLTILVPITFTNFSHILPRCRKEQEHE